MIQSIAPIFGSKTKAQEILLLLHHKKEVVRQAFTEKELPLIINFCKENNLHLVKSRFKVLFKDNTTYSNSGIRISDSDPRPGFYFVYLSKDEEKAWQAAYYETTNNHQELGKMLGYPDCCINFFCQNFNENRTNLEHSSTNPLTNLTKRENDAVLISHFPCNSECKESVELAKEYYQTIKSIDPKRSEELLKILSILI